MSLCFLGPAKLSAFAVGSFVAEFRTFHNSDPPRILKLWHSSNLGPSAAEGFPCDILEVFVFSQPFFDRAGVILAFEGDQLVGFVHAGFGVNADETAMDFSRGTISAIVVHPDFRRQGIARELIARAELYLQSKGATSVTAGAGLNQNGYYIGIYGGLQPSGFAQSAAPWDQLFEGLGYVANRPTVVMHRNLTKGRDPVSARLIRNRRRLNMIISDRVPGLSWWWHARFGQLDALRFELREKGTDNVVASAQIVGLDVYVPKWGVRAVGIQDVFVPQTARRHGYALSLIVEVCRRLREQSIQLVEAQMEAENEAAIAIFQSANFERVEELLSFRKTFDVSDLNAG